MEIKMKKAQELSSYNFKPSAPFVASSWVALFVGVISYLIGLWNASMQLNEKGFYFSVITLGLFSAISLQKTIRDNLEGIKVTGLYISLSWSAFSISLLLLIVGLWNATLLLSEKGFFMMSFTLSLFAAIVVQKNVRDLDASSASNEENNEGISN